MGRGQVQVFTLTLQDAQALNIIVASILIVYSYDAHVLYDLGFTYSYVSTFFTSWSNNNLVLLDQLFYVTTPIGESLLVNIHV